MLISQAMVSVDMSHSVPLDHCWGIHVCSNSGQEASYPAVNTLCLHTVC